jgi:serine/threonine protein kinase
MRREQDRMNRARTPEGFGPYRIVRALAHGATSERWVGVDARDGANCTLYRLAPCHDAVDRRRVLGAIARAASVRAAHTLEVREFAFDAAGFPWVVTPYTGNHEGLVTLGSLVRTRGGLSVTEVFRAVGQVLETCAAAHAAGVVHGPMAPDDVLVDRHGSVRVELYGLARLLHGVERSTELLVADEVRSVVGLAYTLLTGLSPEEPRVRASRLVPRVPRALDEWIQTGLDPFRSFASPSAALAAMRGGFVPGSRPSDLVAARAAHSSPDVALPPALAAGPASGSNAGA